MGEGRASSHLIQAVENGLLVQQLNNVLDAPDVIRDSSLHRRGYPDRPMNPTEVVVKKVDSEHMLVVLYFLTKPIC
jgi:hypothetical protein